MLRFTIRDLLWLTLVAGLMLECWCWWRSIPVPVEGFIRGQVLVSGKPMNSGRVLLHSADGHFRGTQIAKGLFDLQGVPYGKYGLTFEGDSVPPNRFDVELNYKCQAQSGTFAIGSPPALISTRPSAPIP
jgi:hypothetical protein